MINCKGNHSQGYCFKIDKEKDLFIAYCDHCGYYQEILWSEVKKKITHL